MKVRLPLRTMKALTSPFVSRLPQSHKAPCHQRLISLVVGCLLSLSVGLVAQTTPPTTDQTPPSTTSPVDRWVQRLREIDGSLKREDWSTAGRGTESLLIDMTDSIQGGNRAAPLMAMGTLFRAIAAAGLERKDDAMWDWYAAQTLHDGYAEVALNSYGRAGAFLLRQSQADSAAAGQVVDLSQPEMADPLIVAPTRTAGPAPIFPVALRQACVQGTVRARLLVGAAGLPKQPRILDAPGGPPMALAALEAMRLWRFQPARLAGTPISVYLPVEVPFILEGCTPAGTP